MGSGLKIAFSALLVCALAGAAAASAAKPKPKPQPTYRVSVKSTYVDHAVITVVEKPNANGCRQRYDLSATQTVVVSTTTPVVRTLAQLKSGQFPPLQAHETRNGSERNGWEIGCPALKDDPADVTDTSGCGAKSYAVTNTSLGYLAATGTRFAFRYTRRAADPYDGNCMAEAYDDPDAETDVSPVVFPPANVWGTATDKKPFWADLVRTRLASAAAGRPIVLTWNDTAKVSEPFLETDDPTLEQNVTSDEYTLSWQVTIVKRAATK
jgi:hypothetical protein